MKAATRMTGATPSTRADPENVAVRFAPRPARAAPHPWRWHELPRVELAPALPPGEDTVAVPLEAWQRGDIDFYRIDAEADALGQRGLVPVAAGGHPEARVQLLTRCQRWLDRRNRSSRQPWFDEVLALHRRLHDRALPLVRADHNHALDTWQWLLRLQPAAGGAVQVAALFHDIERLTGEAERRVEQHADDYARHKREHAARSAARVRELLAGTSAEWAAELAAPIIEAGDQIDGSAAAAAGMREDVELLEDADALSFFSLNSAGFLDYYGERHTARKIEWTVCRLSARALRFLVHVRLRRDVAGLLEGVLVDRL